LRLLTELDKGKVIRATACSLERISGKGFGDLGRSFWKVVDPFCHIGASGAKSILMAYSMK
tara:strand:- start:537 stop:719 length:183 start_codon:yes stop_codon:yes gene_type:complete